MEINFCNQKINLDKNSKVSLIHKRKVGYVLFPRYEVRIKNKKYSNKRSHFIEHYQDINKAIDRFNEIALIQENL